MRLFSVIACGVLLGTAANAADITLPAPTSPPSSTWESSHFSFLPRAFQKNPYLDVMIVTEATAAGKAAPQASPDHPIYYTGSDGGLVTVGEVIGGEVPPASSDLAQILVKALAVSGFEPATKAHPPEIFIHYRWGSFNRLPPLMRGPDDLDRINLIERAALVGGEDFARRMIDAMNAGTLAWFEDSTPRNLFLVQEAHDDRYFIVAVAYDFQAATQGRIVALWRTKISTNSRGVMMDESLPQLVASAAPYFGHPTDGAVRLSRPTVKAGHVEIGTPTIKEELPPDEQAPQPEGVK